MSDPTHQEPDMIFLANTEKRKITARFVISEPTDMKDRWMPIASFVDFRQDTGEVLSVTRSAVWIHDPDNLAIRHRIPAQELIPDSPYEVRLISASLSGSGKHLILFASERPRPAATPQMELRPRPLKSFVISVDLTARKPTSRCPIDLDLGQVESSHDGRFVAVTGLPAPLGTISLGWLTLIPKVAVLDAAKCEVVLTAGFEDPPEALRFFPDDDRLAISFRHGPARLRVISRSASAEVLQIPSPAEAAFRHNFAISADGEWIAVCAGLTRVRPTPRANEAEVWNVRLQRQVGYAVVLYSGLGSRATSDPESWDPILQFTADGRFLVFTGADVSFTFFHVPGAAETLR